jgi:plasmid rolling circle replication initiator protein Rep
MYRKIDEDGSFLVETLWDIRKERKFPRYKLKALYLARRLTKELPKVAHRMRQCALNLKFAIGEDGERRLREARFCEHRACPLCQWRRSMLWVARFKKVKHLLEELFPESEYIWLFATLTIKSPPLQEMRATLKLMQEAWALLTKAWKDYGNGKSRGNKDWIFEGFVRTVEISRGNIPGYCHPHYHCLLLVRRDKYVGSNWEINDERAARAKYNDGDPVVNCYLSKMWGKCLKLDYPVQVSLKKVMPKTTNGKDYDALTSGVYETIKYCVKIDDLLEKDWEDQCGGRQRPFDSNDFTPQYINQMYGAKTISVGGILRNFLGGDIEDLIHGGQTEDEVAEVAEDFERYAWDDSEAHPAYEHDLFGSIMLVPARNVNEFVKQELVDN